MADLTSWGSFFQTEAAMTTKAQSPVEERRVAGMASEDDAAERMCFRLGTSATRRTSDDRHLGVVPLMHWNISVANLKVTCSGTRSQWS